MELSVTINLLWLRDMSSTNFGQFGDFSEIHLSDCKGRETFEESKIQFQ